MTTLKDDAQTLLKRARDMIALPVLETTTGDGTVVKPITAAHLAGAANALKMAYELLEQAEAEAALPDDPFDAPPAVPGQVESREAFARLEEVAKAAAWWTDYEGLRQERDDANKQLWNWREAVYIAWASMPVKRRWPKTQDDLIIILGLTDARTIRQWRSRRPEMDDRVARLTGDALMKHRAEVLDALIQVAQQPDPRSHSDRRLFLEMTGDYTPRQGVEHTGAEGGPMAISITEFEKRLRDAYGDQPTT